VVLAEVLAWRRAGAGRGAAVAVSAGG